MQEHPFETRLFGFQVQQFRLRFGQDGDQSDERGLNVAALQVMRE